MSEKDPESYEPVPTPPHGGTAENTRLEDTTVPGFCDHLWFAVGNPDARWK